MNLKKKKKLIARTLGVGVKRIRLNSEMSGEVKEAITRQDIRELKKEKVIKVKEKKGKKKKRKRKTKRRAGSRKKSVKRRKENYVKLTRKLRSYLKRLKNSGELSREEYYNLRKKIRARTFRSFVNLKEVIRKEK